MSRALRVLLLCALSPCAGCVWVGAGVSALSLSDSGGGQPPPNARPIAEVETVDRGIGVVPVLMKIIDRESDPVSVRVEVFQGDVRLFEATEAPGESEGTENLSSSPSGELHLFLWDSVADFGDQVTRKNLFIRLTARDARGGGQLDIGDAFQINNTPTRLAIETASFPAVATNILVLAMTLTDLDDEPVDVRFRIHDGVAFREVPLAAVVAGRSTQLRASPEGTRQSLAIDLNHPALFPGLAIPMARLEAVAVDLGGDSPPDLSPTFAIDNSAAGLAAPLGAASAPASARADLDGDGFPDTLVFAPNGAAVNLVLGEAEGAGVVVELAGFPEPARPTAAALADLDGDGRPELALAGEGRLAFYRGTGLWDSPFEARPAARAPAGVTDITVLRFAFLDDDKGDGRIDRREAPDLLVAGGQAEEGRVVVFLGGSAEPGLFPPPGLAQTISGLDEAPLLLAVGQVVGDESADLVIAGARTLFIARGLGGARLFDAPRPLAGFSANEHGSPIELAITQSQTGPELSLSYADGARQVIRPGGGRER